MKSDNVRKAAIVLMVVLFFVVIVLTVKIRGALNKVSSLELGPKVTVDKEIIDMVKALESELEERASFGYRGERDPFTGRERIVAKQIKPIKVARKGEKAPVAEAAVSSREEDDIKLTAVITEVTGNPSAVIMVNDRSMTVEKGDQFLGRKNERYEVSVVKKDMIMLVYGNKKMILDIHGTKTVE